MLKRYFKSASGAFDGKVVMAGPYLYDNIDGVCKFFDGPSFIYNLIDYPDDMKRLLRENREMVQGYKKEFYGLISPKTPGFSGWGGMYWNEPWSGGQCDFCALIGRDMFKEFCLSELTERYRASPFANYYHLDGEGELIHLDDILSLPNLKTIQWVPGVPGQEKCKVSNWKDLFKRFAAAGLNIWFIGPMEELEELAGIIGTTKGIYWHGTFQWKDAEKAQKLCEKFGVPFNL